MPLSVWAGSASALRGLPPEEQRAVVAGWWGALTRREIFVLHKLLTGALRVASSDLVERALAEAYGLPAALVGHRLTGAWEPSAAFFAGLVAAASGADLLAGVDLLAGHLLAGDSDRAPEPSPDDPTAESETYRIAAVLT